MNRYRKYFPVTKKYVYFNHAAVSPMNTYTLKHTHNFLEEYLLTGSTNYKKWVQNAKLLKAKAAAFVKAKPEEMAIIKNTTSGILLVANGLKFKNGDNVIIPEKEFPANVYPWLNLKSKGVGVKFVKWRDGRVEIKDILRSIDSRTKLVSVSHVQFTNGFRIDLEELGHELSKRGVLLFVDAIQSMGVFDIDVVRDNVDFLAADSHKWLLGPEGVGFFYCKPDNLEKLTMSNFGYMSVASSDDYLDYDMILRKDASRFEEGSLNMLGIHTLLGSLNLIEKVTVKMIRGNILNLTDHIVDGLKNRGCIIKSPRDSGGEKSGIVSFVPKDGDVNGLYKRLMNNNFYVALRDGAIRISPHFYNTKEEGDRLIGMIR